MPIYAYRAYNFKGQKIQGLLSSLDIKQAQQMLIKEGYLPYKISLSKSFLFERVEKKVVLHFLFQLGELLCSGMTLMLSLENISLQTSSLRLKKVILELQEDLRAGVSFSQSLKKHPKVFSQACYTVVKSGEEAGKVGDVLKKYSQHLYKENEMVSKCLYIALYPLSILAFTLLTVIFLVIFIIPSVEEFYITQGLLLPSSFILTSVLALQKKWLIVSIVAFSVFCLFSFITKIRDYFLNLFLKIPVFKLLLNKIVLLRFLRNFSFLLNEEIPLLKALEHMTPVIYPFKNRKKYQAIIKKFYHGEFDINCFCEQSWIDPMTKEFLKLGIHNGRLPVMIEQVLSYHEASFQNFIAKSQTLLTPLLMVILGIVVGGVIFDLFLPLFDIQSFLSDSLTP